MMMMMGYRLINGLKSQNKALGLARRSRFLSTRTPQTKSGGSGSSIAAFLALGAGITAAGAFAYMKDQKPVEVDETKNVLVPNPHGEGVVKLGELESATTTTATSTTNSSSFNPKNCTVVFVLGGPGAGKGTQCQNLVRDYQFVHLSAGDLLREERNRPGSKYGELIDNYIKEGLIVPMEITIALLERAMKQSSSQRFLIDGFPRKMDQALKFEQSVVPSQSVLYFECPEDVMMDRLLKRGSTSGRVDDNPESIKKRFKTFRETSFPVIEHFQKMGKVHKVDCRDSPEKVYENVRRFIEPLIQK